MEAKKGVIVWVFCIIFHSSIHFSTQHDGNDEDNNKIIIIGAGMAGIAAAKTLQEMGHENFLILEGSDRIGGRTKEVKIGNYTVEAGSLWIHGTGNNPLYQMAKDYNLSYITTDYDDMIIYDENGDVITDKSDAVYEIFEAAGEKEKTLREDMINHRKSDTTLRQIFLTAGWIPKTPLDDAVEYYDHDFELSFTPDAISAIHGTTSSNYKALNSTNLADLTINDLRGYSHIHRSLLSEVLDISNDSRLIFEKRAINITQNDSHVIVQTDDNASYVANYVINTFSVGVMQNRLVRFEPPLPKWKIESIDQFQMAVYYHMYFQFPTKFWDDNEYILYASSRRGYYTVWQNIEKLYPNSKILLATLVGEEARRIDRMSDEEIKREVLAVLQKIFVKKNIPIPEPTAYVIPRWLSDPLFKGCYSNWTPGYSLDTHRGLCAPVGRFYFAGEACKENFEGYMHGAYFSGKSQAENILRCLKDKSKCSKYTPEYSSRGCTYNGAVNYKPGLKTDDGSCKRFPCSTSKTPKMSCGYISLVLTIVYHIYLR